MIDPEGRRTGLASLASNFGLQFLPDRLNDPLSGSLMSRIFCDHATTEEGKFLSRFHGFWPFGERVLHHARDVVYGSFGGMEWTAFDYCFELDAPQRGPELAHRYGIVCGRLPVVLPFIHLSPQDLRHRMECCLGFHEVDFEVEEFNERYFIRADDKRAAYDVLHPRAIEYLLGLPRRDWQIRGSQIVLARHGEYGVEEIPQLMKEIEGFAALIPEYVRDECVRQVPLQ